MVWCILEFMESLLDKNEIFKPFVGTINVEPYVNLAKWVGDVDIHELVFDGSKTVRIRTISFTSGGMSTKDEKEISCDSAKEKLDAMEEWLVGEKDDLEKGLDSTENDPDTSEQISDALYGDIEPELEKIETAKKTLDYFLGN